MKQRTYIAGLAVSAVLSTTSFAQAETLRLLTWGSYAPEELIQKFEAKYPDIEVEVTFSNNEEMIAKLPEGCVLLLDEAYIDLAPAEAIPDLDIEHPGVIRMRTFSKGYGLAGMRVGYALGASELIRAFEKIRNHFGMNRAALAGAQAALMDAEWLDQTLEKIDIARDRIAQIGAQNGLTALPSATNFVAIDCGRDGTFAKAVLDGLVARGIFIRMPFCAPQNRCIRISCGSPEHLDAVAAALPEALAEATAAAP